MVINMYIARFTPMLEEPLPVNSEHDFDRYLKVTGFQEPFLLHRPNCVEINFDNKKFLKSNASQETRDRVDKLSKKSSKPAEIIAAEQTEKYFHNKMKYVEKYAGKEDERYKMDIVVPTYIKGTPVLLADFEMDMKDVMKHFLFHSKGNITFRYSGARENIEYPFKAKIMLVEPKKIVIGDSFVDDINIEFELSSPSPGLVSKDLAEELHGQFPRFINTFLDERFKTEIEKNYY